MLHGGLHQEGRQQRPQPRRYQQQRRENQLPAPSAAQTPMSPSVRSGNLTNSLSPKSSTCAVLNLNRLSTGQASASIIKTTMQAKKKVAL